jgi:hypothetical protein
MRTVNGKLITEGKQQLDAIKHNTANIMQTHQDLDAQVVELCQQNVKYLEEINLIKNHLTKLDKRCILLEESITRQFIQFIVINICGVIGLAYLWFSFNTSSQAPIQPANPKNRVSISVPNIK